MIISKVTAIFIPKGVFFMQKKLCLITLIYKGQSQIDQLKKDSLGKNYEITLVLELAILAQKWSEIAAGSRSRKAAVFCCAYRES